jgi:hypothetical protein
LEQQAEAVQPKACDPIAPASEQVETTRAASSRGKRPVLATRPLQSAQSELGRGDIPAALEHYERLIKKGRFTGNHPRSARRVVPVSVEVTIWQALGDAYMRANRLQEALMRTPKRKSY